MKIERKVVCGVNEKYANRLLIKDIDGLYEAKRNLNTQLMFDHVTNACSRRYLDVRMTESFNLLLRGQLSSVAVCVFDIDYFKEVSCSFGVAEVLSTFDFY